MTTKMPKRKQRPSTECPAGKKKRKIGGEIGAKNQRHIKSKATSRMIRKRKVNAVPNDVEKKDTKQAEEFRNKLKSGVMAMSAIRHFLQEAHKNPNLIAQYIRAGGTFKPLMDILASCEKDNPKDIADVMHLIQLVMIQSLDTDDTHVKYATKNARSIMENYQTVICGLLQDQGEQAMICKASALRILRAILLVDANSYWRDVLKVVDISMAKMNIANCRESTVVQEGVIGDSLRTVFIEFNLALLIDTPTAIVRYWLTRSSLVLPLMSNLVFDHAANVILVMRTLQQYVLGNADIDKYIYRTAFTPDILKALVSVYEWVGPEKLAPDEQTKKSVFDAAEEFVLPLLTSRRCFLVPKSFELERTSPRYRQLILGLKHPQMHDHQRRLVLAMLEVCPEVLPVVMDAYGGLLKFTTASNRNLLKSMLQLHNPVELIAQLEPGVSAKALSGFVIRSTLPRSMLDFLGSSLDAQKKDISMCLEFFALMATRCEEYLRAIEQKNILDQFGLKKVKVDAINHIVAHLPSIDRIMAAMVAHRNNHAASGIHRALESAMDFLLVCIRTFPAYMESSSFITTYRDILKPAYSTPAQEHLFLNYEFKAIKVVIALEPQSVSFSSALFPSVLQLLAKVYLNGSDDMRRDATEQLLALFRNTALFDNRGTEIEFWFQALGDIEPLQVPEVVLFLAKEAKQAAEMLGKKSSAKSAINHTLIDEAFEVGTVERRQDLDKLFTRVELDAEENVTISGMAAAIDAEAEIPITDNFFMYMFGKNAEQLACFRRYFDGVSLRYLHYLPHPEIVERALKARARNLLVSPTVLEYTSQWMAGQECVLDQMEWDQFRKLSESFVKRDRNFTLDETTLGRWKDDRSVLLSLFHQTLFFLSRWVTAQKLTPKDMELVTHYSKLFLDRLLQPGVLSEHELNELMSGVFLQRPVIFENFTIIEQEDGSMCRLMSGFVCELMRKLYHLPQFERYTALYSNKIVSELMRASTSAQERQLDAKLAEKLLGIFKLHERHCVSLLRHYSQLQADAFFSGSQRTCHYQQLCFALEQLAIRNRHRQEYHLQEETVQGLVRIYKEMDSDSGLEELEHALLNYLNTFPHSIAHVDPDLMRFFFDNGRRIGKALVKLATFLLERSDRFQAPFLELVGKNVAKKELVYPLLAVAFRRGILSEATLGEEHGKQLLTQVYTEFKGPIIKMLEKPNKAAVIYRENPLASEMLVRLCMPRNECVDFARKKLRIEAVEPFQVRVLMEIYGVALKTLEGGDASAQQAVYSAGFAVLLQCFETLFRSVSSGQYMLQQDVQMQRLNELVLATYRWAKQASRYKKTLTGTSFASVTASAQWNSFCKTCLKLGIDTPRCSDNDRRYDVRLYVLPKLMALLVDQFYADGVKEQTDIERFYDWALSHSNFLRVILLQYQYKPKTALVHLLYVLARKNPSVVNKKHVPILLGAYDATLTDVSRYLLALLQHYEHSGVEMHEFRPFLWGETAIKHFALESGASTGEGTNAGGGSVRSTFRTKISEIFPLLIAERVTNSIEHYPTWRKLDPCAQLPETNFDELLDQSEQDKSGSAVGGRVGYQPANTVERFVEKMRRGTGHPPTELLEMHEVNTGLNTTTYDPAFLVPMLNMLFANEQANMLHRCLNNGLLALPFVCLSSTDEQMRLAAAGVILRIRAHLELTERIIDSKFWLHLFSSVQRGFAEMSKAKASWSGAGKNQSRAPIAPFLSMIFIAETIKLLPNVMNKLHAPMAQYVLKQNVYNFRMVPNFLPIFNNDDVEHDTQRMFMLRTIFLGIRSHRDFAVLRASPILHVMMSFHGSPLSNREQDMTILNLMSAMAKIPKSCEFLVDSLGLLGWLSERIDVTEGFHFDTIDALLGLVSNCWYSMQVIACERTARAHHKSLPQHHPRAPIFFQRSILILTLKFLPLLSTRSTSNTLLRLLNLLDKATSPSHGFQTLLSLVSTEVLQQLVEYFENLFGEHMWCVRYVRQCGSYGCDDDSTMNRKLLDAGVDQTTAQIVVALRRFVIRWSNFQKLDDKCDLSATTNQDESEEDAMEEVQQKMEDDEDDAGDDSEMDMDVENVALEEDEEETAEMSE